MIPLRPATLFRSRWAALLYAAGVLWFAVDVAGSKPEAPQSNAASSSDASPGNDADVAALEAQVHAFEKLK